ncbi:hypothetical protein GCM10010965_12500 [Caldalkalibacillus thermarum]|uniref:BRO-N domain-containing protein n=1 Tax=Caldalkalibacillus thermarum TaxID=296745 RepID=UPI00166555AC|nr:BRO family protein [Caldalkalibacillus thermarum]GGK20898.1 hypothetical protein GCM10010965_12500 [Caldalkalibacillus thermarum]
MNQLQHIFDYHGQQVRTVVKDGEPWFVLKDVCHILDLGQVAGVKRRLSKDVISNHPLETPDGIQQMTIINEDGLYDVILESRKPEARAFRKWVTKDVLPTIRKTGQYSLEQLKTPAELMLMAAQKLVEHEKKIKELEERTEAAHHRIDNIDMPETLAALKMVI